jgi:hypothetical protein
MLSYIWHNVFSLSFLIGVFGNLVASAVLVVPELRRMHVKIEAHHLRVEKELGIHRRSSGNAGLPSSVDSDNGEASSEKR